MTAPVLEDWIGRSETVEDTLDLRPARLMQSILPAGAPLQTGDVLPPLWNWLYFHEPAALDQLGRDGHPKKGGFLPPVPLPRRMWAGGRFEFMGDLKIGAPATKRSEILKVVPKEGRTGPLCFVTVEHRYMQNGETLVREEHDIVYREDPAPGQAKPAPAQPPETYTDRETVSPSLVMLFRYSALTFNGHRIHYDRDYSRSVEGYPDLVFHGPLTATFLADFCRRKSEGRMKAFDYRALSPLFDTADFDIFLNRSEGRTEAWASTPEGHLAMKAEATFD